MEWLKKMNSWSNSKQLNMRSLHAHKITTCIKDVYLPIYYSDKKIDLKTKSETRNRDSLDKLGFLKALDRSKAMDTEAKKRFWHHYPISTASS